MEVYSELGIDLHKPYLRAAMEADMKQIEFGTRTRDEVLRECVQEMRKIFLRTHGSAP